MPSTLIAAGDELQGETAALDWLGHPAMVIRRTGSELEASVLFDDLAQPGMFAEDRFLLYTDILSARLTKKETDRVAELLRDLPEQTRLACVQVIREETKSKSDTRFKSAGMKTFAVGGKLTDIRQQAEGRQAADWVANHAQQAHGLRLSPRQAERLLAASDGRPVLTKSDLIKLELYKEQPDQIWTVPDSVLDGTISGSPSARFYDLATAMLGSPESAQAQLANWFSGEPETFRLIFELRRRLLQARSVSRGEQVFPHFAARDAQALARRYAGIRLGAALEALANTEHGLKSGGFPAESARAAELAALQLLAQRLALSQRLR